MKIGMRTPSLKRSFKARTTGRVTRSLKKSVNPMYGKKGTGYITNPERAVYNAVYNKTTFGVNPLSGISSGGSAPPENLTDRQAALLRVKQLQETAEIINHTTNPKTFFTRYDFAITCCDDIKQLYYTGVINGDIDKQRADIIAAIPDAVNSMIERARQKEYNAALKLKTEKGRKNRMIRFYNSLLETCEKEGQRYITQSSIDKINELINADGLGEEIAVNLHVTSLNFPPQPSFVVQSPPPQSSAPQTTPDTSVSDGCLNGCLISNIAFYAVLFIVLIVIIVYVLASFLTH